MSENEQEVKHSEPNRDAFENQDDIDNLDKHIEAEKEKASKKS